MSIFARPASDAYCPEAAHQIHDVETNEHYEAWEYRVGYVTDDDDKDVPPWGNTAILRITEDGMTEPVLVTKPEHHASFTVSVLAGSGVLIRALASGAVETIGLKEGDEAVIEPGQAYSWVNTGKKDLLLHDVAMPAFRPGDEIKLTESCLRPEGDERQPSATSYIHIGAADEVSQCIALSARFYDLMGEAAAGRMKT